MQTGGDEVRQGGPPGLLPGRQPEGKERMDVLPPRCIGPPGSERDMGIRNSPEFEEYRGQGEL